MRAQTANRRGTDAIYTTSRLRVVDFLEDHAIEIEAADENHVDLDSADMSPHVGTDMFYSVLDNKDRVIAIFGVIPYEDFVVCWAVLSIHFRRYAKEATQCVSHFIDVLAARKIYTRIVATVKLGFEAGDRWIRNSLQFDPINETLDLGEFTVNIYERTLL